MSDRFWMHERVADLRSWAKARIVAADIAANEHFDGISRERASQERDTLREVLRVLDGQEQSK